MKQERKEVKDVGAYVRAPVSLVFVYHVNIFFFQIKDFAKEHLTLFALQPRIKCESTECTFNHFIDTE